MPGNRLEVGNLDATSSSARSATPWSADAVTSTRPRWRSAAAPAAIPLTRRGPT